VPNDYTSCIPNVRSFSEFLINCADKFKEDDCHSELESVSRELQNVCAAIENFASMTDQECEQRLKRQIEIREDRIAERRKWKTNLRAKYDRMLADVRAWNPQHVDGDGFSSNPGLVLELKEFLEKQIVTAIDEMSEQDENLKYIPATVAEYRIKGMAELNVEFRGLLAEHKRLSAEAEKKRRFREILLSNLYQ
jgi:Cft2 family RNA processing exonuclease